jgi:hypothetical protein
MADQAVRGRIISTDQALVNGIEYVLDANPDGLNEREIRRAVLEQSGLRRRPPEVH